MLEETKPDHMDDDSQLKDEHLEEAAGGVDFRRATRLSKTSQKSNTNVKQSKSLFIIAEDIDGETLA